MTSAIGGNSNVVFQSPAAASVRGGGVRDVAQADAEVRASAERPGQAAAEENTRAARAPAGDVSPDQIQQALSSGQTRGSLLDIRA